jgi:hypothetical protein
MSKFGAREWRASRGPSRFSVLPFRWAGRAPHSARTRTGCGVLTAPTSERNSIWSVIVPADGTRAATVKKRRLRVRLRFCWQLSDKPLLACIWSQGVRGAKRNGWSKIKCWAPSWRNAVVQLVNWLGGRRRKRFEFNRAALIRPEGERMSQLLISLIGAIEHENRSEA